MAFLSLPSAFDAPDNDTFMKFTILAVLIFQPAQIEIEFFGIDPKLFFNIF